MSATCSCMCNLNPRQCRLEPMSNASDHSAPTYISYDGKNITLKRMLHMTSVILGLIKLTSRKVLSMDNDYFDFNFSLMLLLRNPNYDRNILCHNVVGLSVLAMTSLHLEPL